MFKTLSTIVLSVVLIGGALPMTGCQVNPATGQRQFNLLSEAEEIRIGNQAAPEFIDQSGGEIPDRNIQQYVTSIGQRMAARSERPELPWEFTVLNTSVINAFALPGGKVFISRGMMERMENEAQLAAVLGHEIGHVTAQHIGQQMSQAMVLSAGLAAAGAVTDQDWLTVLGGVGGGLYLLRFGRDQESQADELGLRYMTDLNYDPVGMLGVMEILREAGGARGGIEWLQTHPMPDTRINRIESLIRNRYPHTQNNPQYRLGVEEYRRSALEPLRRLPAAPQRPTASP